MNKYAGYAKTMVSGLLVQIVNQVLCRIFSASNFLVESLIVFISSISLCRGTICSSIISMRFDWAVILHVTSVERDENFHSRLEMLWETL